MRIYEPLNPMDDGTCRTIKSQYQQTSIANLIRHRGGYIPYIFLEIDESDTTAGENGLRKEDAQLV